MAILIPVPPTSLLLVVFFLILSPPSEAQQSYVSNKQLNCNETPNTTLGFVCNGASSSCPSFLTFRSTSTYNSPVNIAYLLSADASQIAAVNNISDVGQLPLDTLVVIPINCACNSSLNYYQHDAAYDIKTEGETYLTIANDTYQALSTCQAMSSQNPYDPVKLHQNMRLAVPLRCACPTRNQTAAGFRYLLTYLVRQGEYPEIIANNFAGAGADVVGILAANELSSDDTVYYFTPLLVPLKIEPTKQNLNGGVASPAPPPSPPPPATTQSETGDSDSNKGIYIGVGIGAAVLILFTSILVAVWFLRNRRRRQHESSSPLPPKLADESGDNTTKEFSSWSVLSEGIRSASETLTVYKFADLEKATEFFSDSNRINGSTSSVYRASFNGDDAVVKIMKGDVSREIDALRQVHHARIVRLSGFCEHHGQTYLVYEYAENGPLADWLHPGHELQKKQRLDWKQRIQIAYDVADALNYLHNFTSPPYIHKNLTSANILLDSTMRAKVSDFGLARTLDTEDDQVAVMTRHVVGTYGYMAPEYVENGLVTPKMDVYALGVVILELLSGRGAVTVAGKDGEEQAAALSESIKEELGGENVKEKLREFIDPQLGEEYPVALAYSAAELARSCVSHGMDGRPVSSEVFVALSKLLSSSLEWDPSFSMSN